MSSPRSITAEVSYISPDEGSPVNEAVYYHSQGAANWESNYKKRAFIARKRLVQEMLAADNLNGQRWLDAGCGTGTLARVLAGDKGCHVLGVDASEAMISNCLSAPNTEFRHIVDLGQTALPDSSFDGVLCSSVLEYVSDPRADLTELQRILKKDGLLLISVPNRSIAWWPMVIAHRLTKHLGRWRLCRYLDYCKNRYSESDFRRLLDSCGFRVKGMRSFGGVRGIRFLGYRTMMMFRAVRR